MNTMRLTGFLIGVHSLMQKLKTSYNIVPDQDLASIMSDVDTLEFIEYLKNHILMEYGIPEGFYGKKEESSRGDSGSGRGSEERQKEEAG